MEWRVFKGGRWEDCSEELRPKGGEGERYIKCTPGRQAGCAKALSQQHAWRVQGRTVWSEWREGGERQDVEEVART